MLNFWLLNIDMAFVSQRVIINSLYTYVDTGCAYTILIYLHIKLYEHILRFRFFGKYFKQIFQQRILKT